MSTPTATPRQQMITILEQLPEDSTFDELFRELAFRRMIDRGLQDVATGKTVDNDEARRQIKSWQR
jgi:predicted transcriptional regulator